MIYFYFKEQIALYQIKRINPKRSRIKWVEEIERERDQNRKIDSV